MKSILTLLLVIFISPAALADSRIITVAKSGGDFTDPIAAMNSIKDADSDNRYNVQIGPGLYNLGIRQFRIKPYVSVEGAGRHLTTLEGSVLGKYKGLVRIESGSELSSLTINNSAGVFSSTTGIYVPNRPVFSSAVIIRDVQATGAAYGMVSLANTVSLIDTSLSGTVAYQAYKSSITMKGGSLISRIYDQLVSIGGTNIILTDSHATLESMKFRGGGYEVGGQQIVIRENSTLFIKYSNLEFSSDTRFFTMELGSQIKVISSEFSGEYGLFSPNQNVLCVNSSNSTIMMELTRECQNP